MTDRSCTHTHTPLFPAPFRLMTAWATLGTCIVAHICGKDEISPAQPGPQAMHAACQPGHVLANSWSHTPRGGYLRPTALPFSQSSSQLLKPGFPRKFHTGTYSLAQILGGGLYHMNITASLASLILSRPSLPILRQKRSHKVRRTKKFFLQIGAAFGLLSSCSFPGRI